MLNLVRELDIGKVPTKLAIAINSERSELLKAVKTPLPTVAQVQVLDALGIFIDSNRAQGILILELHARIKGLTDLLTHKAKELRSLAYQFDTAAQNS